MQREQLKNVLLVLVAIAVGYLCFQMVSPFLIAISWAAVFAILVTPIFEWLAARLRSRSAAAAVTCLVTLLLIILPSAAVIASVTRSLIQALPQPEHTVVEGPSGLSGVSAWVNAELDLLLGWVNAHFGVDLSGGGTVADTAKQVVGYLAGQSKLIVGGVAGFFFNLVIVIFTLFFFLRDREIILRAVRDSIPLSDASASSVFRRVRDVIRASVIGGGAVALSQGLLAGLGFWVLGVPSPLLWGVATSFFSFVPLLGAATVWVPTAAILFLQGHPGKGIALLCWGTFAISLVDNILRPILIGDATRLHTLLIFFSILGGLQVFGFLGLIMGPVVLAVGLALVDIFRREMDEAEERRRGVDDSGDRDAVGEAVPAGDPGA